MRTVFRRSPSSVPATARVVRGCRADRSPLVMHKEPALPDPCACDACGAVRVRKSWHHPSTVPLAVAAQMPAARCPACRQAAAGRFFGQVVMRGPWVLEHAELLERRIGNVARQAAHRQPERRIVDLRRTTGTLEVLTTSQKLAHRIAHELRKAFGGRLSYRWSDRDGALRATWDR